ncbi:mitochondria-eating protein [Suncus etruscus]|uniref:mitochondria-eating protein n=1 Tax=Suncus etruscus TaxID=109475 RepID=UPI00210FC989|nr:mitochondria-eating protein [Suncus etruscus]
MVHVGYGGFSREGLCLLFQNKLNDVSQRQVSSGMLELQAEVSRLYFANSYDQNLSTCLEIIEQVAKIQGQCFKMLTETAKEGGHFEGVEILKSRLLPWLESSFNAASAGRSLDSSGPSLQDTFDKERQRDTILRDQDFRQLDSDLTSTRNQLNQVQDDMATTEKTLEDSKNRSAISLLAAEEEINQLRKQLKYLQAQEDARHKSLDQRSSEFRRSEMPSELRFSEKRASEPRSSEQRIPDSKILDKRRTTIDASNIDRSIADQSSGIADYEKQVRNLKDEIAVLSAEKTSLQGRPTRSRSPSPSVLNNRSEVRSRSRRESQSRSRRESESRSRRESQSRSRAGSLSRNRSRPESRSHSRHTRGSDSRSHSQSPCRSRSHSRSPSRSRSHSRRESPSALQPQTRSPSPSRAKGSSVARKAALLSRFSDAYSQARQDAQCLLRRCIDKAETVQRIIYIATVEAFHVAKMAFRHFKIRVRKSLTPSYVGSNDFEDAVSDYIICHLDLYDSQSSVNDVIRAMNVNPKISFPPEVDFCLLSSFIQEICCIAFAMQTLEPPLDIAFGADGEIFNDCKYRRSYDSDFTAPLVFYHVWPALMENDNVIMKGEAVTKRGAFWNSVRSLSRCRSRSLSPIYPRSHNCLSTVHICLIFYTQLILVLYSILSYERGVGSAFLGLKQQPSFTSRSSQMKAYKCLTAQAQAQKNPEN